MLTRVIMDVASSLALETEDTSHCSVLSFKRDDAFTRSPPSKRCAFERVGAPMACAFVGRNGEELSCTRKNGSRLE